MTGLWIWSVIVALFGVANLGGVVNELAVEHSGYSVLVGSVLGLWIWGPAAVHATRRQGLTPDGFGWQREHWVVSLF